MRTNWRVQSMSPSAGEDVGWVGSEQAWKRTVPVTRPTYHTVRWRIWVPREEGCSRDRGIRRELWATRPNVVNGAADATRRKLAP